MNYDDFVKLLQERGEVVYIVDRGLIRFGKFAITFLSMLGILGALFFGFDVKRAAEEAKSTRLESEKTRLDLGETKKQLISAREELSQSRESFVAFVSAAKQEIQKDLDDATASSKRTLSIEQEVTIIRFRMKQLGESPDPAAAIASAKAGDGGSKEVLTPGSIIRVALVSETKELEMAVLSRVAAALQKQVSRDLKPVWNVDGTVEAYKSLKDVPPGYWPIIVKDNIGFTGVTGIHLDKDGQPFALVKYLKDDDDWTLHASSQLVDMLVDPLSNRVIAAPSPYPEDNNKVVDILVEIAQPIQGKERGYRIDGVLVTDFVTPEFFSANRSSELRYSLKRSITGPLKILKEGYITWTDRDTNEVHQMTWFDGDAPKHRNLGKIN
jgi:hypothetical protein